MLTTDPKLPSHSQTAMCTTRPTKRRKFTIDIQPSLNGTPALKETPKPSVITHAMPKCVSCHRALNIAHGLLIVCARCSSPTCAICSRTCTASPTSMPPTPYLTRSPTPSQTPPTSPRRSALSIHSANTNLGDVQRVTSIGTAIGEKRRKNFDEDNQDYLSSEGWLQKLGEFDLTSGCGRTVCRNCCMESKESALTTCHDCAEHLP